VVVSGPHMAEAKPERRSGKRVVAEVPVSIRSAGGSEEATGRTRDLSSGGIFLYSESRIEAGSTLEMVLILPPELTQGRKRWVCCQAAVLRVEDAGMGKGFGVAASIRNMEFLPEVTG
jgi:c-di-GMP-binding flagellar brake protein YcgR